MENTFNIYTEISPEIPPLYHYTSQAGIIGMVVYKKLWFTNIHFMNDSTEYSYALKEIRDFIGNYDFGNDKELLDLFPNDEDIAPIFSFSLTAEKDLLSQWRGYCPNGGYSISFFDNKNLDPINLMMKTDNLYIGKCLYDKDEIKKFIAEKIVELTPEKFKIEKEEAERCGEVDSWLRERYYISIFNTLKFAPLIKDKAFSEEQEWRIVANYAKRGRTPRAPRLIRIEHHPNRMIISPKVEYHDAFDVVKDNLKFRQGKSFLIPYLEIPLGEDKIPLPTEVIVGPTPHKELSMRACELLLLGNTETESIKTKVTPSKLPYRNW